MEFKPIKGYEGIYEACSDGTIWSCEGKTTYSNWHGRIRKRVWKRRKLKLQTQKRQRGGKLYCRIQYKDKNKALNEFHRQGAKYGGSKCHEVELKEISNG